MKSGEHHVFAVVVLIVLLGVVGLHSTPSPTGMQTYDGIGRAAQGTTLENALSFLQAFGFFNVILPFLLIFTIVFGILEKTRIFGTEKHKGENIPRRNLNSVVSFCIAFFVVAASNVVTLLQVSLPIVAMVLVVLVVFLLLFGTLMGEEELKHGISLWKMKGMKTFFTIAIFIAVLAILLAGFGILDDIFFYVGSNLSGTFITSIILLVIVIGAMWFVVGKRSEASGGEH